jgi:hypothetical protein
MLKRNGQLCQRNVPGYSGRLTDFEFLAYNTVFESVEEDYEELAAMTDSLTETERSFHEVLEASDEQSAADPAEVISEKNGTQWQVVHSLLKSKQSELLFCKRQVDGGREYSIVERLDPNSALARSQGVWMVHMTSNDARLLLQDFIEGERQASHLCANDIVATAQEQIEEKYPGEDLSRVVKAISERCRKKTVTEEKAIPIRHRQQKEGVRA